MVAGAENLEIATRNSPDPVFTLEEAYDLFPVLEEKRSVSGTSLSGGQQQMLAIARGLVRNTKLLLLDEPMVGLAPTIVREIKAKLEQISEETTILVVAQHEAILDLCEYAYVLDNGQIVHECVPDREDILAKLAL
jgi:branched-chain amino acid transport system ATP-binding protein